MLDLFLAAALAAGSQDAAPAATTPAVPAPASAGPALEQIPGVTVQYYSVSGKNDKGIRKSIAEQRPAAADGQPIPASTSWTIDANVSKQTIDGVCKIAKVTPNFKGNAILPQLATPEKLKPEMLQQWNAYVAGLKSAAADQLAFVRNHLDDVEQAVSAASCDGASAALDGSLAKLKAEEATFLAAQAAQRAAEAEKALAARNAAAKSASESENPSYDPKND